MKQQRCERCREWKSAIEFPRVDTRGDSEERREQCLDCILAPPALGARFVKNALRRRAIEPVDHKAEAERER